MAAGLPEQEHQQIVTAFGASQRRAVALTERQAASWWGRLSTRDLTGSWEQSVGPALVRLLTAGQLLAATPAQDYVEAMVAADGLANAYETGASQVKVRSLAGVAADGRALDSLMYLPVIRTKTLLAGGMSLSEAMVAGQLQLRRIIASEVADAGRGATGIAIAANRTVTGYVRVVQAGACARCVILAGRWYRVSAFQRHPRCQCYSVPSTKGRQGRLIDPHEFFDSLSKAEQDRRFTAAGAQAIRDGADLFKVVNARRGMYSADQGGRRVRATREGTTRRGTFFQLELARAQKLNPAFARNPRAFQPASPRLLPDQIYRVAQSRTEVIDLLRRYGYLGWSL